ncbi:unnamed protein product, partial [Iphiclides podalirius]
MVVVKRRARCWFEAGGAQRRGSPVWGGGCVAAPGRRAVGTRLRAASHFALMHDDAHCLTATVLAGEDSRSAKLYWERLLQYEINNQEELMNRLFVYLGSK